MFNIPAFGETKYEWDQINAGTAVVRIPDSPAAALGAYCDRLEAEGFVQKEAYQTEHRRFAAYEKDGTGVFLNYFPATSELQLVTEENTAYFTYADTPGEAIVTPQLTQLKLTDYGLSYVIRLTDGRFLVIDGGSLVQSEADWLFDCLKAGSPHEKPIIAGWLITHPHSDHYHCFFLFMERYGAEVVIEKFFFNFSDPEDFVHYPKLEKPSAAFGGISCAEVMKLFLAKVAETGAPVYTPHTGQRYRLGNTVLDFLATLDDSIHCSQNINATSLMFATEIAGQNIFWGGDGSFSDTRLPQRYGTELKADMVQVPHHGFGCGADEAQIQGYRLMDPRVCLHPASENEAFSSFCTYKEGSNYLMTRLHVEEWITGKTQRTLELPYEPSPSGAAELRQRYLEGRDNCGARVWVFSELDTGRPEDFLFTVLNTTFINADITAELYFENVPRKIVRFRQQVLRRTMLRVNCAISADDTETVALTPDYLESKGIPANTNFAVRFTSNIPVVISSRHHTPAYKSSVL